MALALPPAPRGRQNPTTHNQPGFRSPARTCPIKPPPDGESRLPAADGRPVLDWNAALERVRGRPEYLRRLADLFFQEAARLMPEIRAALDRRDGPVLRRTAHTLKGSAGCFVARPVIEAAERLEFMGRDNRFEGAAEAWADLEREVARLLPALEAHVKGGRAAGPGGQRT